MEPRDAWKLDSRIWFGLGVLALGLVMFVYTSRTDGAIAAREGTAEGIVTAQETELFGSRYNYVFSVNGQWFTGWDSSSKNDLGIGMQVFVYYDSQNPNKNALTDFVELSRNPWLDAKTPYGSLAFGVFLLFMGVVFICTGKAYIRFQGWVYRSEEPKVFWWSVGANFLLGALFIGDYVFNVPADFLIRVTLIGLFLYIAFLLGRSVIRQER